MNKQVNIILTEDACELLKEVQEHISKKEMLKDCTQAHAITKALIVYKDTRIDGVEA